MQYRVTGNRIDIMLLDKMFLKDNDTNENFLLALLVHFKLDSTLIALS